MIGSVISGRYVVQAIVGTGGMAVVYRAFDKKKNRIVAIKVLRPEYESDEEFVRRFSREAEAASKVSHENIVNMLDVGIDGDMRYIVMEYVDGQTLKEMIRQRGTIHPDTAIRMTIRILAAVDHAHRNGIVHRDIKPQNILVDNQGRVKVADFGIARLKASQTTALDEGGTTGSALGSVHYFSPEQARGEVADEKSDLYSVGVVMYEMLTGQVPFDGETSVSVALKHVNEPPRSMRDHQEGISKALDEVVMRALCKDPSKRYQTAAEMAADLRKTISRPEGGFVTYPKDTDTLKQEKDERRRQREKERRKLRRTMLFCLSLGLVLIAAAGAWYFTNTANTYVVPDLVGQEQLLAQDVLEQLGGASDVSYSYSEEYEEGIVISQSRRAGARVKQSVPVVLTVSRGSQWYYLEDFVGQRLEDATDALRAQGVETVDVNYVQSEAPVGSVVSVSPQPGRQTKDEPVTLSVSGQRILMPSLIGFALDDARKLIEAENLQLGTVTEAEAVDAVPGTVIAQSVEAGAELLAGAVVDITVNQARQVLYYPISKLSVVVPLNGSDVQLALTAPSGNVREVYHGVLNAGTYRIALDSDEPGQHTVNITMDGVLMESRTVNFE
ncbi:MAG: protein kinase [Clostridia bacterium]|nr:protein kinase [Clostridia bacterium]